MEQFLRPMTSLRMPFLLYGIVSYASLGFLSVPTASCSVCTDNLGSLSPHMQQLQLDHKHSSYWFSNLFFSDSLHKTEKESLVRNVPLTIFITVFKK